MPISSCERARPGVSENCVGRVLKIPVPIVKWNALLANRYFRMPRNMTGIGN